MDRKFGVEIEFKGSRERVNREIQLQGVACQLESYNHNTRHHWKIVTDASLGYTGAGEVVSPILQGEQGLRELELVCKALDLAGATVDRACGLHIHLDSRDMTPAEIKTVFTRYAEYENQIDQIMPRSRRGNARWCGTLNGNMGENIKRQTFSDKMQLAHAMDRYHKVNLTNVAGRGSIEFRQHSGTTNYAKISNWLSFLQQFVNRSIALTGVTRTPRRRRVSTSQQRWYNQLRKAYEQQGGEVFWNRRHMKWEFVHNGGSFMLTNSQIHSLYVRGSSMRNVGLAIDWKSRIIGLGGFPPRTGTSATIATQEDSLTEGLSPETVEWLQRRAAELN